MEEILASIRRIIADDQAARRGAPSRAGRRCPSTTTCSTSPSVAEAVRARAAPSIDAGDRAGRLDFDATEMIAEPVVSSRPQEPGGRAPPSRRRRPPQALARRRPRRRTRRCCRPTADASGGQRVQPRSAHTVLTPERRTLEDLVKDMLRPMLKSWLDDNLPALVERLVRAEIERRRPRRAEPAARRIARRACHPRSAAR